MTMEKSVEKSKSDMNRAEYIEVEPNVCLHITDAGEGRPIVLIPGWPSDCLLITCLFC